MPRPEAKFDRDRRRPLTASFEDTDLTNNFTSEVLELDFSQTFGKHTSITLTLNVRIWATYLVVPKGGA